MDNIELRYGLVLILTLLLCSGAPAREVQASAEVKRERVRVDTSIFEQDWNQVPFPPRYFTFSDAQLRARWDRLSRGLQSPEAPVPFPDVDFVRSQIRPHPRLRESIRDFNGDHEKLQQRLIDAWRAFFAGRFQKGRRQAARLGGLGELPELLCQLMYALYLADRHSTKKMLLQDIVDKANAYFDRYPDYIARAERDPPVANLVAAMHLVKTYALARIAEEAPVPVIAARGYIRRIQNGADEVLRLAPGQPLGLAFDAAVGAGIMRRMGKFTGRVTYGARITTMEKRFDRALERGSDIPIIHYEYANALIYMNRKREINTAIRHLEKAVEMNPEFAMDALDVLYSWQRLQEVRLYALNFRSFREFDQARREYAHVTDHNLTNVLTDPLTMDRLKHPEKYKLPERD